jgi:hypothetical protein
MNIHISRTPKLIANSSAFCGYVFTCTYITLHFFSHCLDLAEPSEGDVRSFTPALIVENFFATLMQLDDLAEPGVSEDVFRKLVKKCRGCRTYMTSRVTLFHDCKGRPDSNTDDANVIDLTNED